MNDLHWAIRDFFNGFANVTVSPPRSIPAILEGEIIRGIDGTPTNMTLPRIVYEYSSQQWGGEKIYNARIYSRMALDIVVTVLEQFENRVKPHGYIIPTSKGRVLMRFKDARPIPAMETGDPVITGGIMQYTLVDLRT